MSRCPSCQHCNWLTDDEVGECRRYPPVFIPCSPPEFTFPIVQADDWCGEFRSRLH